MSTNFCWNCFFQHRAYWDDRCNLYGDLREFVIHFFLSDETMEIREIIKPNTGYDSFPCFLRRGKLAKVRYTSILIISFLNVNLTLLISDINSD